MNYVLVIFTDLHSDTMVIELKCDDVILKKIRKYNRRTFSHDSCNNDEIEEDMHEFFISKNGELKYPDIVTPIINRKYNLIIRVYYDRS